jgi:hypothetical protein
MNYTHRKKERKAKKILTSLYQIFQFKSINLSFSSKITVTWSIVSIVSLFIPWIIDANQTDATWNAFNPIAWNIGFWMILLLMFIIFIVISNTIKEKIKLALDIRVKNYIIIIITWVFILVNSVIYISFVNWLALFLDNIVVGNGVILYMVSWIMIIIWGILERKEYRKRDNESFINEESSMKNISWDKDNMKLPF